MNQPPDLPPAAWVGPLGEATRRYSVPVFRCSIPSPSWLRASAGLDDCLTKPVSREALNEVVERFCHEPATILVVDDNPGFVSLIARMLGATGRARRVLTAYTGAEAVRLAKEAMPQLMLLDLLMPGMDGFAVVEAVRAEPRVRRMRIVAVTATSYAEEALLRRGGQFTVSQSAGISSGALAGLLSAALGILRPDYVVRDA